jgi:hypothetical protein
VNLKDYIRLSESQSPVERAMEWFEERLDEAERKHPAPEAQAVVRQLRNALREGCRPL